MPTPSHLTAVSFAGFPFDMLGKADTFIRLRPEHLLRGCGPVLTRRDAPQIATPQEAEREGEWEPRYGMTWWPVERETSITPAELATPLSEQRRRLRAEGPREVEVTPEFVRKLLCP